MLLFPSACIDVPFCLTRITRPISWWSRMRVHLSWCINWRSLVILPWSCSSWDACWCTLIMDDRFPSEKTDICSLLNLMPTALMEGSAFWTQNSKEGSAEGLLVQRCCEALNDEIQQKPLFVWGRELKNHLILWGKTQNGPEHFHLAMGHKRRYLFGMRRPPYGVHLLWTCTGDWVFLGFWHVFWHVLWPILRTVIRGDRGAPPFILSPETATVADSWLVNRELEWFSWVTGGWVGWAPKNPGDRATRGDFAPMGMCLFKFMHVGHVTETMQNMQLYNS